MSTELVERLRAGPIRTGDSENGEYELYDIEDASEAMAEAADELTAITAKVALLTEALRPFATFAENNTDDDGWAGTCQRDRIVDWFVPSDFRAARRALSEPDKNET